MVRPLDAIALRTYEAEVQVTLPNMAGQVLDMRWMRVRRAVSIRPPSSRGADATCPWAVNDLPLLNAMRVLQVAGQGLELYHYSLIAVGYLTDECRRGR
jgi:hypothetical protein